MALKRRKIDTARAHFDTVLNRDPSFVNARWLRGRIHLISKNLVAARTDFEEMIRHAPQNPNGYLELARLELVTQDFGKARAVLQRGKKALPGHPTIEGAMVRLIRGEPL